MTSKQEVVVNIGFDDIDSPQGGCTTHFVSRLIIKWSKKPWIEFIDYPNLIRLAPGVPWKTRGNGGLVVRVRVPDEEKAFDLYEEAVVEAENYAREFMHPESHPALAMVVGHPDKTLEWLGHKAVQDIIPKDLLLRVIDKITNPHKDTRIRGYRGLVGAYASIGVTLRDSDYTYELIAYRKPRYWGKPRLVDPSSVKNMDLAMKGKTFLNYDHEVDKPLITPHGPDPVLFGIRGEEPEYLVEALQLIHVLEPIDMWIIYRTNQATDMHLRQITSLNEAYIYTGIRIVATVYSQPRRIRGGHVVFKITDNTRELDVAAYEPTGGFRNIVEKLLPGDIVEVYGIIRPPSSNHGPTLNLEKIRIIKLAPRYKYVAPRCPRCSARMESMGRGKGYRCRKCGYKDPNAKKIAIPLPRDIAPGFYQPPPRSFKHLMKPIERFGREKKEPPKRLYVPWYWSSS